MKKIISILLLAIILTFICCTKDFVVQNIKNVTMTVNAPGDNITTPNNVITFWWEEVEGVEKYNLQIVKPNFNSVVNLLLDTNITTNKFNFTFTPGTYQWRVRATNANGSTPYITRTLTIDSTSNLNTVSVKLNLPTQNSVIGKNSVTFKWAPLASATNYDLVLTGITTTSFSATVSNITETSQSYTFPTSIGKEELFSWEVIAFNTNTNTQTIKNESRTFKIDLKAPLSPYLISPNTYSLPITDTYKLKWSRANSTDVKEDIISLSTDSFSTVLASKSFGIVDSIKINTIFTHSGPPTKYWWQAVSVDSAGNHSTPALSKAFYLK